MLHDFFRFGVAGTVGFIVDVTVLFLIVVWLGEPPLLARLASFSAALVTTWLINRLWTFRRRTRGKARREVSREFARYGAVALTAGAANYAIYAMLILAATAPRPFYLLVSVVAGVAAGMFINFLGARNFVFPRRR
jgi:putative flippase GtrA